MKSDMTFNALKRRVLENFDKTTYEYIIYQYPVWKQNSDAMDSNFWTAWILSKSVDEHSESEIKKALYDKVSEYFVGGKTFDEILDEVCPDDSDHNYDWDGQIVPERFAWEQLGKVAIRQGWVQLVKKIYNEYKYKFTNATEQDELQYTIDFQGKKEGHIYPMMPTF